MDADTVEIEATNTLDARGVRGLLSIDALDKRTRPFRRYEAIRGAVLADMGGEENTSEVQRQLISKFATLALQTKRWNPLLSKASQSILIYLPVAPVTCAGSLKRWGCGVCRKT